MRITAVTIMQLVALALALGLTLPLVKQEFFASNKSVDDAVGPAVESKPKRAASKKKTSRPVLDCGSDEVQRKVTRAWREEVAQALSSKPAVPLDDAREFAAGLKLALTAFQILDEDRAAGFMQCAAVVSLGEGDGFQGSDSQVTYRIELVPEDRSLAVTLIYARIPRL